MIDVVLGTQRLKMLPAARRAGRATSRVRRGRHHPLGRRDVSARRHAPRRSGEGLRDDHRGVQRPLRLLRGAVHPRPRADARQGRHPGRRARRRSDIGPARDPAARADRQPLPGAGRSRAATSRSCWPRSTTCPASSASASPARIRATPAPRLIEAVRDLPEVCKHLHLPVQSGSTRVLRAMRRRHTREEYLDLVARDPRGRSGRHAVDRHDRRLPGRDRARTSSDTLSLVEAVRYHSMFSFKYSARPNTLAAKRMPDDVTRGREDARASWRCRRCSGRFRRELHERRSGRRSTCWWIR